MEPPLVLGALAIVSSVGLIWWSLAVAKTPGDRIELGSYSAHRTDLEAAAKRGSIEDGSALVGGLAQLGRRLTPAGRLRALEERLLAAGSPKGWTAQNLLAFKGAVVAATALMVALRLSSPSLGGIATTGSLGALGFFLPDVRLKSMTQDREQVVRRSLAETVDQITIMVQAGLSVDGAIARTARTTDGPLSAELTRVSQDIRAGIPRTQALLAMAERIQLPELRQVVTAMAQAEKLGVPIAHTLQVQATELREKRRQQAEEQAMKLPVKILFPTVICIMPSLFLVILGPAVINIFDTFN